jgi:hypothetical protein
MRRNFNTAAGLAGVGAFAAALCMGGCHRDTDRSWGVGEHMSTSMQPANLSTTGVTGSSASPYTEGKPRYDYTSTYGTSGSSASPYTHDRSDTSRGYYDSNGNFHSYDTRPGMMKDKSGCCTDK